MYHRQYDQQLKQNINNHREKRQRLQELLDRGTPLSEQQQEELTNHSNEVNRLEPALTRWNDATARSDYESLARQTLNHEGLNQMMTQSMVPARARTIQQELEELREQAIQERQKSIQLTRKFGN